MIRICKQLAAALNEVNNETIQVTKEHGYYIVKCGGYESHIAYTLKELVNDCKAAKIELVYKFWTMQGMKVMHINGIK